MPNSSLKLPSIFLKSQKVQLPEAVGLLKILKIDIRKYGLIIFFPHP
jgi:hypothetical protein